MAALQFNLSKMKSGLFTAVKAMSCFLPRETVTSDAFSFRSTDVSHTDLYAVAKKNRKTGLWDVRLHEEVRVDGSYDSKKANIGRGKGVAEVVALFDANVNLQVCRSKAADPAALAMISKRPGSYREHPDFQNLKL